MRDISRAISFVHWHPQITLSQLSLLYYYKPGWSYKNRNWISFSCLKLLSGFWLLRRKLQMLARPARHRMIGCDLSLSPTSFSPQPLTAHSVPATIAFFLLDVACAPHYLKIAVHASPFALFTSFLAWPASTSQPSSCRLRVTALVEPPLTAPGPHPLFRSGYILVSHSTLLFSFGM